MNVSPAFLCLSASIGVGAFICGFRLSQWLHAKDVATPPGSKLKPNVESFLLIHNTCAKRNIGSIVRTASALGVAEVLFVGPKKSCQFFGAHGSQRRMRIHFFHNLRHAVAHVRSRGATICGIEITSASERLDPTHTFRGNFFGSTCFLLGNEGCGLTAQDKAICDTFLFIPQCGVAGTASLNVATACGIVLYAFASWAGYEELARHGEKFDVAALGRQVGESGTNNSQNEEEKEDDNSNNDVVAADLDTAFNEQ
eukprot:PhM_4_TR13186/c0_g1_i1/m.81827